MTKYSDQKQAGIQGVYDRETKQCSLDVPEMEPLRLVDQLRAKRSQIAREAASRTKKLDRHISLLEQSDAQNIVDQAQNALYGDD